MSSEVHVTTESMGYQQLIKWTGDKTMINVADNDGVFAITLQE